MSAELLSYAEAAAFVAKRAAQLARGKPATERVKLAAAAGRVLAETLRADTDQPPFARSTRDGYACRAAEISAHQPLAVAGATRAGDPPSGPLAPNTVWEIMTGAPVPRGADAVVMLEHVEQAHIELHIEQAHIESAHPRSTHVAQAHSPAAPAIRLLPPRTIAPGENIVARAAQARKGAALLPAGTLIGAAQIALAASCGFTQLAVYARPRVAILSTGDELVPISAKPKPGQIRNSSAAMLAAMVSATGGHPWILPIARDTAKSLDTALIRAAAADLLLITGGVSAGKFDLVEPALARMGARFHFTGVRIQPGKPVVFGELPRSTGLVQNQNGAKRNQNGTRCCVYGLPGNPISSAVTFLLFAAPILAALAGRTDHGPRFAQARLAAEVKTKSGGPNGRSSSLGWKPGLTRFLPAACTFTGPVPEVMLVSWQGSGDLAAMAQANCYLVVPEDSNSLKAGATVTILLP
jgi:molybdopterin molybdotransferase